MRPVDYPRQAATACGLTSQRTLSPNPSDSTGVSLSLTKVLVDANRAQFHIRTGAHSGTLIGVFARDGEGVGSRRAMPASCQRRKSAAHPKSRWWSILITLGKRGSAKFRTHSDITATYMSPAARKFA
jgi:hypothetical protein